MLNPKKIIEETEKYYNLNPGDILSHNRLRHVSLARNVAMYITRKETDLSLPAIGVIFKRDHSSVLAAHRRIIGLLQHGVETAHAIEVIESKLAPKGFFKGLFS